MSPAIIRPATRRDIEAIVGLWLLMMREHCLIDPRFETSSDAAREYGKQLMLKSRSASILVADHQTLVVGFAASQLRVRTIYNPNSVIGNLTELCVEPEWRRQGIGSDLAREAISWMHKQGAKSIELTVAVANSGSNAFWRELGFRDFISMLRKEMDEEQQ